MLISCYDNVVIYSHIFVKRQTFLSKNVAHLHLQSLQFDLQQFFPENRFFFLCCTAVFQTFPLHSSAVISPCIPALWFAPAFLSLSLRWFHRCLEMSHKKRWPTSTSAVFQSSSLCRQPKCFCKSVFTRPPFNFKGSFFRP